MTRPWQNFSGLERLLTQETNISDLLKALSDYDPEPWMGIVGFVPTDVGREVRLGRTSSSKNAGNADLLLTSPDGRRALVEVKLGHLLSEEQQRNYESLNSDTTALYLAALGADEIRVTPDMKDRWSFLNVAELFITWCESSSETARVLSREISQVLRSWDGSIDAVLRTNGAALDTLTAKFITRVVTRRVAANLRRLGHPTLAGVTSGGGLPLVQAWAPVNDGISDEKWFIAEVRWWETKSGGELRFGVDYQTDNTPDLRREAHQLAHDMQDVIDAAALRLHLQSVAPELAEALPTNTGSGRPKPRAPQGISWDDVIEHGFGSPRLTRNGRKLNRLAVNPGFYGDGTLRFEALAHLNFGRISAPGVVELLDQTLRFLRAPR